MNIAVPAGTFKGQHKIRTNSIWLANIDRGGDLPLMHLRKQRIEIYKLFAKHISSGNGNCAHFISLSSIESCLTTDCGRNHNKNTGCGPSNDIENDEFIGDNEHDS